MVVVCFNWFCPFDCYRRVFAGIICICYFYFSRWRKVKVVYGYLLGFFTSGFVYGGYGVVYVCTFVLSRNVKCPYCIVFCFNCSSCIFVCKKCFCNKRTVFFPDYFFYLTCGSYFCCYSYFCVALVSCVAVFLWYGGCKGNF